MKILLVDDNALFLTSAQRFLANFAAVETVATARDGLEALNRLGDQPGHQRPDVVLMDLNLPGMNGFEATQRIKALAPDIRVIIVSLHDAAEFRTAAVRAGAEGFVAKQDFATILPSLLKINGTPAVCASQPEPDSKAGRVRDKFLSKNWDPDRLRAEVREAFEQERPGPAAKGGTGTSHG